MAKFSDNSMASILWELVVLTAGALASGDFLIAGSKIDASRIQGFRILKTQYFMSMRGATTGQGGLLVGMSHALSNSELGEMLDANPQRPKDTAASEQARRPAWPLEILMANADGDGRVSAQGEAKIGWSIQEGTGLDWWLMNASNSTLTTGAVIVVIAKHFGVWLKD